MCYYSTVKPEYVHLLWLKHFEPKHLCGIHTCCSAKLLEGADKGSVIYTFLFLSLSALIHLCADAPIFHELTFPSQSVQTSHPANSSHLSWDIFSSSPKSSINQTMRLRNLYPCCPVRKIMQTLHMNFIYSSPAWASLEKTI